MSQHPDAPKTGAACRPADGSPQGRVGTPDILSLLALDAALDVWDFDRVTIDVVRATSPDAERAAREFGRLLEGPR